jgi:hypothetical protein
MKHVSLARTRSVGRSATAIAAVAAALGTAFAIAFTNADAVVARGFAAALEDAALTGAMPPSAGPLVAGSEEYWLTKAHKDGHAEGEIEPAAWSPPSAALGVAVGDRITITSGGAARILEVVEIAAVNASVTRIDTSEAPGGELLVTCRDTGAGDGRLVRFLTYSEPAAPAHPERTL